MKGTIQKYFTINEQKTNMISEYYLNDGKLDEEIAKQFMGEYVVDYCLCNYDATFRNFIVDNENHLRGVDKEQCFKYISQDNENDYDILMEHNYNSKYGAKPTIYGKLIRDIKNGKLPISILQTLRNKIEISNNISADAYILLIAPYISSLNLEEDGKNKLIERMVKRKKSLNQIDKMIDYIANKEKKTIEK